MRQYLIRRLLLLIPTIILISILVFSFVRFLPGSVVSILVGDAGASPEEIQKELHRLGLDQPVYAQYFVWFGNVAQGDLGRSLSSNRPVIKDLERGLCCSGRALHDELEAAHGERRRRRACLNDVNYHD